MITSYFTIRTSRMRSTAQATRSIMFLTRRYRLTLLQRTLTIYVRVENFASGSGCATILPFQIIVVPPVSPPTGNAQQNFTSGQTLADLAVNGENITWYDQATEGNELPSSTVLPEQYYLLRVANREQLREPRRSLDTSGGYCKFGLGQPIF